MARLVSNDGSLWLTQALMAELFQVKVPINEHLKTLYAESEL